MTMLNGFAASGAKVHAVDPGSARNVLAARQGWVDVKTGHPYAEAVCGVVALAGEDEWADLPGLTCKRCAVRLSRRRGPMSPAEQLAAASEAVARVRAERGIRPDHDSSAADDGPDRSPTDPADRMPDTY